MTFSCNTLDFPSISSFEKAKAHFNKVKPWRGDTERPIGVRSHKNKGMRELHDGSIAFRLYHTDCVIWHPDGTLTVEGYASMSTTSFIGSLVPDGVSHAKGRKNWDEPVLHLQTPTDRPQRDWPRYGDPRYSELTEVYYAELRAYWNSGSIIQCSRPVHLHYSAETKRWEPTRPDELDCFNVPTIDRTHAREVSREYNLPTLEKVVNAVVALANLPEPAQSRGGINVEIMRLLKQEDYMSAIALMPRGTTKSFGRRYGTPNGIKPGFLRDLRDFIYEREGAVENHLKPMLTPGQYKRYVRDSNRFS